VVNSAALVVVNTSTYQLINEEVAGFQSAKNLVINLTRFSGTLPDFGAIAVNSFFVWNCPSADIGKTST
jgi:hypothetical protein